MADFLGARALVFDLNRPSPVLDEHGTEIASWRHCPARGQALFDLRGRELYRVQRRSVPGRWIGRAWALRLTVPDTVPADGWIGRARPPGPRRGPRRRVYEILDAAVAVEHRFTSPLEYLVVQPDTERPIARIVTAGLGGRWQRRLGLTSSTWRVDFTRVLDPVLHCIVAAGAYSAFVERMDTEGFG